MPLHETDGVVLRSYNLAEADRIVVIYTRDNGLIRGVAKGARRLTSKFGSALEPFGEVHVDFFAKDDRELVSLRNADLIRSSFETASDPELLKLFSYFAELLLETTPQNDPNPVMFRMLRACFATDADADSRPALALYFEVWLLRLTGYLPDWTACAGCGRELGSAEVSRMVKGFDQFCGNCVRSDRGEEIAAPEREMMRAILKTAPADFIGSTNATQVRHLRVITARLLASVTGRDLVSTGERI